MKCTILLWTIIKLILIIPISAYSQDCQECYGKSGDQFVQYKIHTEMYNHINDSITRVINENTINSFVMYSIHNLWKEDTSGVKEYRLNVINFLSKYKYINLLKIGDICKILGEPVLKKTNTKGSGKISRYYYDIYKSLSCNKVCYRASLLFDVDSTLIQTSIESYSIID
jgi:hypothetical protein